jgi:hypothetical protein
MDELDSAQVRVNEIVAARQGKPKQRKGRGHPPVEHQFQPGQSGNPAGLPPGTVCLRTIVKRQLEEVGPGARHSVAEELVANTIERAMRGSAQHLRLVWESCDPPHSSIDVSAEVAAVDRTSAAERLEAALAQIRGRIHEEMTEAEREAEEVKIDADYDAIQRALAAADPRRAAHKLELYASYAGESIRMTGCYCDRLDCASRRDEAG